jgi:hypothetical protein
MSVEKRQRGNNRCRERETRGGSLTVAVTLCAHACGDIIDPETALGFRLAGKVPGLLHVGGAGGRH